MTGEKLPPRSVYKYEIRAWSIFLDLPRNAQLLHVGVQRGTAYVWALVDPDAEKVQRVVFAHPTGDSLPGHFVDAEYVGTFRVNEGDGELVFHVFDGGERVVS